MVTFTTSQKLKLYVLAHGMQVDPAAEQLWQRIYEGPLSLSEYPSTSGIALYTEDDIYVNAPFRETFTLGSEVTFAADEGGFVLRYRGEVFPVKVIPVPSFHKENYLDESGQAWPYTDIGVTHTDRCRISPIVGCASVCTFCDLYLMTYRKKPLADMLRTVELGIHDPQAPARHFLISGGTPRPEDETWIDDVYAAIAAASPIPVDVMLQARADLNHPKWLRSVGINMLSINIEVFDPARARRIIPTKFRRVGIDHYLRYIERAVEAFGVGFVQSLIVFGSAIEPIESTIQGVRELVKRGCMPVLSPFRPDPTTPMGKQPPASLEEMRRLYEATMEICEQENTGVWPGPRCIPCQHNTLAFPINDFYVPLDGDLAKR